MKCSKAYSHLLIPLLVLASCTKESLINTSQTSSSAESNDLWLPWWKSPITDTTITDPTDPSPTTYGLDYTIGYPTTLESKMDIAGVKLVRNQLILSKKTRSNFIDQYIQDGYKVQINLNWSATSMGPVDYPTDLDQVKERAEQFFQYYAPYVNSIPVVVVENEWDNTAFHNGDISDYMAELAAITEIGHRYGFKIADAGLSSTNLRRWTYSTLSGDAADTWATNYFVGPKLDTYATVIQAVNTYAAAINNIPIDYLNVHWYNNSQCFNGFQTASQAYLNACNKQLIITNEFGIKTNSNQLFYDTVDELRNLASYAICYSNNSMNGGEMLFT